MPAIVWTSAGPIRDPIVRKQVSGRANRNDCVARQVIRGKLYLAGVAASAWVTRRTLVQVSYVIEPAESWEPWETCT
jgi:hypothetical protein